jgi:queuine tRNA-ribosyltransferase
MFEFKIISENQKSKARTGVFNTPHGQIETPIFMPVGTLGSVKGISPDELHQINAQIILANTYHLYLRPGPVVIQKMGGLHKWMNWSKPILTDSGGFQVFSLGKGNKKGNSNVKIKEDGVEFKSHLDGSKHFFGPKNVMEIQHQLGADIIMQIDECAPHDSSKTYAKEALERTHRWAEECLAHHQKLEQKKTSKQLPQALFPIVQGTVFEDLRMESVKFLSQLNTPGLAIGGLSVGEARPVMYHILDTMEPYYPKFKPRYLMGVGTPEDLLESIARGIDMFDCVHATRIGRHGNFYDQFGRQNIKNAKYAKDPLPLDPEDLADPTFPYSKSYIHHLVKEEEIFGLRLLSLHNLYFLLKMMKNARTAIKNGSYTSFKKAFLAKFQSEN